MPENSSHVEHSWQGFSFGTRHNICGLASQFDKGYHMRIVQSKENTLPAVAKSLKPIMVVIDLIAGGYFVFAEEISPKTQTP